MTLERGVKAQVLLRACLLMATLACLCVSDSSQDETNNMLNQRTSITNSEETINIGNKHTNNYRFLENNYQPSQSTQVVLNVGKLANKKLRKARPPSMEEMAIKERIIQVYEEALNEVAEASEQIDTSKLIHLKHLRRILYALNPKYIATERVMYQAFADPKDPGRNVIPPEYEALLATSNTDTNNQQEALAAATMEAATTGATSQVVQPREFSGLNIEEPVGRQLDEMADQFKRTVSWDKAFVQRLFRLPDAEVTPEQLVVKRLIQCIDFPLYCNKPVYGAHKSRKNQQAKPEHPHADVLKLRVSWPTRRPNQQVSQLAHQNRQPQSFESTQMQRLQPQKQQQQKQPQIQQQPQMQRKRIRSDGPSQGQPTHQRSFFPDRAPYAAQHLEASSPDHESRAPHQQQQRHDATNEYADDDESRQQQQQRWRRPDHEEDDEQQRDTYMQQPLPQAMIQQRRQQHSPPLHYRHNQPTPRMQQASMLAPHTQPTNRAEISQKPMALDFEDHWSMNRG